MTKRKNNNAQGGDQVRSQKRPRNRDIIRDELSLASQPSKSAISSSSSNQPRQDPTYGQRGAFPGLDGSLTSEKLPSGGSEQDELAVAAMAYLRDVRSEAISIPHVLVAAGGGAEVSAEKVGELNGIKNGEFPTGKDTQGYYSDGAYVALPVADNGSDANNTLENDEKKTVEDGSRETVSSIKEATITPQRAYHDRLKALFLIQRRALRSTPSASAVRALSPTQLISLPSNHRRARSEWVRLMQVQHPSPVQLAVMDTETILELLRLVTTMLKRRRNMDERLSAWIWGLLGRLDDVGTLSSEEVCVVRELGKRVLWVMRGFERMNKVEEPEDDVEADDDVGGDKEDECEQVEENGNIDTAEDRSEGEIEDFADEISKETAETTEKPRSDLQGSDSLQGYSGGLISSNDVAATELDCSETKSFANNDKKENHPDQTFDAESQQLSSMPNSDDPFQPLASIEVNEITLPSEHESPSRQPSHHRRNTSSPPSSPSNDLETAKARLLRNINIKQDTPSRRDHHSPLVLGTSPALASASVPTSSADAIADVDADKNADMPIDPNNHNSPVNTKARVHKSYCQENEEEEEEEGRGYKENDIATATDPSPNPIPASASASAVVKTPNINTRATITMILTVAGEFYGQRDLLEERERWA